MNGSLELCKLCTQMQNLVFELTVSLAHGSMSKLVYTRVLLSARFCLSLSWKHYLAISELVILGNSFYADDLVIIAETLCELLEKFRLWKANLESKGLRVNVDKTKILVSAHNAPKPVDGSKFPCGVCNKGVGINSIKCLACGFWVHKRCSNIKGPLKPDTDFKCKKCRGEVSNASIPDISQLLSMMKKSKKSLFAILVISLDKVVDVSMPQQPE